MKPKQLRQLTALADARKLRDLAELEALAAEDRRLVEAMEAYQRLPAQDLAEAGSQFQPAQIALRMEWAERNVAMARQRRAELAEKIAQVRKRAAVSLGKHQALEKLTAQTLRKLAEQVQARAEKEASPPSAPGAHYDDPDDRD